MGHLAARLNLLNKLHREERSELLRQERKYRDECAMEFRKEIVVGHDIGLIVAYA